MLAIVEPAINKEVERYKLNKIVKALTKLEIKFFVFNNTTSSVFDVFNQTNPDKLIVLNSEITESIKRAVQKFSVKQLSYDTIPDSSDVLLLEEVGGDPLYKCDECCFHLFSSDDLSKLRQTENSYIGNFRLYSPFLHSYTAYCGYVHPSKIATAVAMANKVVCLNETTFNDFKLIN